MCRSYAEHWHFKRLINNLRSAIQTGMPLENKRFKEEVEQSIGMKVKYAKRGGSKKIFKTVFDPFMLIDQTGVGTINP